MSNKPDDPATRMLAAGLACTVVAVVAAIWFILYAL